MQNTASQIPCRPACRRLVLDSASKFEKPGLYLHDAANLCRQQPSMTPGNMSIITALKLSSAGCRFQNLAAMAMQLTVWA